MNEYTADHISVIQRFLNIYRSCPEVITRSDRFVSPNLNANEITCLETLVKEGVFEIKETTKPGVIPTFYRLSDSSLDVIEKLKEEGKVVFN